MKIAVAATGPTMDDFVATEFDCSQYLVIVDLDTMTCEAAVSPMRVAEGPLAGELLARLLLDARVTKILANHVDARVLTSFLEHVESNGILIVEDMDGRIRNVVRRFREMCMADTTVIPWVNIVQ